MEQGNKIVISVVVTGILVAGVMYWWQSQSLPEESVSYKEVALLADVTLEVPANWSVAYFADHFEGGPNLSVAPVEVDFSSIFPTQMDFYVDADDRGQNLGDSLETIMFGNVEAKIIPPTPDCYCEAHYFLLVPNSVGETVGLHIYRRAEGDEEFEKGFQHILQTFRVEQSPY